MAMELYITTGKMLGTDLLSEFLEDTSKRARKLVFYHGVDDVLTYKEHMQLCNAQKNMTIQYEEIEAGELLFALGALLGNMKQGEPIYVISDKALLPEGIMERYGIKIYTERPKAGKKTVEKKQERKPRAKKVKPVEEKSAPEESADPTPEVDSKPEVSVMEELPINPPITEEDDEDTDADVPADAPVEETPVEAEESDVSDDVSETDDLKITTEENVSVEASDGQSVELTDESDESNVVESAAVEDTAEEFESASEDEAPAADPVQQEEAEEDESEMITPDVFDSEDTDLDYDINEKEDLDDAKKKQYFLNAVGKLDVSKLEKVPDMDTLIKEVYWVMRAEKESGLDFQEGIKHRIGKGWEAVYDAVSSRHTFLKLFV